MYIKFISDEGPVVVETNSYKVYDNYTSNHKTVVINYVVTRGEDQPHRVEFQISDENSNGNHYRSAFVMNNKGETIDRIIIERNQPAQGKTA